MSKDVSELAGIWATLDKTIELLRKADRIGADKDNPEGVRYIQISDKLALMIAERLESVRFSAWLELPERDSK